MGKMDALMKDFLDTTSYDEEPNWENDPATAVDPDDSLSFGDMLKSTKVHPLYVNRPLVNASDVIAWAKGQGFDTLLPPDEMHVTVLYSKQPVDWEAFTEDDNPLLVKGGSRQLAQFGEATVLRFESSALHERWTWFTDYGASHDFDGYHPHVTLTYNKPTTLNLDKIDPYRGPLSFGGERFAQIDDDYRDKLVEKSEPVSLEKFRAEHKVRTGFLRMFKRKAN